MAESHVITALVRKRAEMAGNVAKLDKQRRAAKARLHHIDMALLEFGYGGDPKAIGPRASYQRMFGRGELRRLVADIVRERGPLSNRQMVIRVKGWDAADTDLLARVTDSVKATGRGIRPAGRHCG